jgi:hypothetical protein
MEEAHRQLLAMAAIVRTLERGAQDARQLPFVAREAEGVQPPPGSAPRLP